MSLSHISARLQQAISSHPIAVSLGLLAVYPIHRRLRARYRAWLALGRGGVPYNLAGWLIQGLIGATISNPTLSLADPAVFANPALDEDYAGHVVSARAAFLDGPLPLRAGPTPLVPGIVGPQRQITQQTPDAALLAAMDRYLRRLAAANKHLGLEMQPSRLEGGWAQAIYLPRRSPNESTTTQEKPTPSTPKFLARVQGETCHVHPDGSSHVTLSLADAAEAVAKGWAQRHKLSGASWGVISPTYLFVYAPRDAGQDLAVWKELMRAGVAFVCGQKIEEPPEGGEIGVDD